MREKERVNTNAMFGHPGSPRADKSRGQLMCCINCVDCGSESKAERERGVTIIPTSSHSES